MRGGNKRKYLQEQKMDFAIRTVAVLWIGHNANGNSFD